MAMVAIGVGLMHMQPSMVAVMLLAQWVCIYV